MVKCKANCVLQIISGDLWAGAEAQMFYLSKALLGNDIPVYAITFNEGQLSESLRRLGVSVQVVSEDALGLVAMVRAIRQALKRIDPAVVHCHGHKENVLAMLASPGKTVPMLRTIHGMVEHEYTWWRVDQALISILDSLALRLRDTAVIAVSEPLALWLHDKTSAKKIRLLENFIDPDHVKQRSEEQTVAVPAGRNNRSGDRFDIVCVARAVAVKRLDIAIRSLCLLRENAVPAHLHIIGDGPLLEELQVQADASGHAKNISFLGQIENPLTYMKAMDVLLLCSDHEGLPMTLLEAMCLRLPVVAHRVGGIIKLMDDGACATLVANHNAEAYGMALQNVYENGANAAKRVSQAAQRLEHRYSAEARVAQYIDVYALASK